MRPLLSCRRRTLQRDLRINTIGRLRHSGASLMTKVYINGKFFDKADAKVSVFDHGLLYGDGVFEGIRVYGGKVFRLREHVDRLYESARHIALEVPLGREQMTEAVLEAVRANNKREGY